MKKYLNRSILRPAAFFSLFVLLACGGEVSRPTDKSIPDRDTKQMSDQDTKKIKPNTDVGQLAEAVKLAVKPDEAVWYPQKLGSTDTRLPGPTDYLLIAVLKFTDAEKRQKFEAGLKADPAGRAGSVEAEQWFPAELKKFKNKAGKIAGDKYQATDFFKPPYSNGILLKPAADSDYFILRLYSM